MIETNKFILKFIVWDIQKNYTVINNCYHVIGNDSRVIPNQKLPKRIDMIKRGFNLAIIHEEVSVGTLLIDVGSILNASIQSTDKTGHTMSCEMLKWVSLYSFLGG